MTPSQSTTYHLVAKNAIGTQEATARVTVVQAAAPPPAQASNRGDAQLFAENVQDIFFAYDSYDIEPQYQKVLQADARFLQAHPNMTFTIEGHCDERGSIEYNLALGDNRANATKQALAQLGISGDRMRTISYGKERPFCTESTESCWQQNRRGALRVPAVAGGLVVGTGFERLSQIHDASSGVTFSGWCSLFIRQGLEQDRIYANSK